MKNVQAYKTIGEVEKILKVKPHVLRLWEESFSQVKPLKRKGGRRLYSEDVINIFISKHNLIRFHLGNKLRLKFIPQMRFYYDDSIEHAQHINTLLQKIHKDD